MFPGGRALDLTEDALERYVAGKREIAPQIEGRITIR